VVVVFSIIEITSGLWAIRKAGQPVIANRCLETTFTVARALAANESIEKGVEVLLVITKGIEDIPIARYQNVVDAAACSARPAHLEAPDIVDG